jgi:hypothetical protein
MNPGLNKKRRPAGEQQAFGLSQNHNKAVHKSNSDLCHHHEMFENLLIDIKLPLSSCWFSFVLRHYLQLL